MTGQFCRSWPPGRREIAIERYKFPDTNAHLGDMVTLELSSGKERQLKLTSIVNDQTIGAFAMTAGGFFLAPVQAYVSQDTLEWMGIPGAELFNVLEATQPSMASRIAPPHARGTALGVYNTLQSLGLFAGGAVGGWLIKNVGASGLFATCAGLMLVWLVVAWPMRAPRPRNSAEEVLADEAQAT